MFQEKLIVPRLSGPWLPASWALVPALPIAAYFVSGWARIAALSMILPAILFARGSILVNVWDVWVLSLFGAYAVTLRPPAGNNGIWYWINPFYSRRNIWCGSCVGTPTMKVNDREGNPIQISVNLWFAVQDSAKAAFTLEDHRAFIKVQTEAGVRTLAMKYPYDAAEPGARSLRGSMAEVAQELKQDIQKHLEGTGLRVDDAKIVHLAYAPEIANLMLARQQADAVVAAREKIIEGAVGTVAATVERLRADGGPAPTAEMVGDMLVALCSRREPEVVVDAGMDAEGEDASA